MKARSRILLALLGVALLGLGVWAWEPVWWSMTVRKPFHPGIIRVPGNYTTVHRFTGVQHGPTVMHTLDGRPAEILFYFRGRRGGYWHVKDGMPPPDIPPPLTE